MMRFDFWDDWARPLKNIFYIFFALFAAAILYAIVCSILGYQLVIDWEVVGQRLPVRIAVKDLQFGIFNLPLLADNYVINQWYQGSDIEINHFATYFFFVICIAGMILGLAAASFLGKVWYYGLTIVFVVALVFFKFDSILLFGLDDNTALILIIASYLGLNYVFYTLRRDFDFQKRLALLSALTVFWAIVIYLFAGVDKPFMLLASNGFLVPFLIGIVFIFAISHEIIHFIVVAITRTSRTTGNNLTHFTLFSLLYLANVLILYLKDTYVIDWNFYYLNPYVLLGVSAVLGLWGLQARATLFDLEDKMFPVVVYLYFAAALCAFGTIFYFLGNTNDAILLVVKDVIIHSHLGFGSVFFIYVIANFMGMLRSNYKVYQVIYKPRNMPHFIFRFAGLIVVTGLLLKQDIQTSVYQTLSGMFNNLGDYYKSTGDMTNAETYYANGGLYGYMNHKSNYTLAKIYEAKKDEPEAITYYQYTTRLRPSEMGYVNLSNLHLEIGDFFNSLFTLNDGLKDFPSGKAILNNKGVLFSKTNISDSSLIYFDASFRAGRKEKVPVVNYLALLSQFDYGFDPDSILEHYGGSKLKEIQANRFLVQNSRGLFDQPYREEWDFNQLSLYSASAQTNYLINQFRFYDSLQIAKTLRIASETRNVSYRESLEFAAAIAQYQRGFVDHAITLLRGLSAYGSNASFYTYTLGLIYSDLGNYREAMDYFDLADLAGYPYASFARQVCQIELDAYNMDSLRMKPGGIFERDSSTSAQLLEILSLGDETFAGLNDQKKYLFLHYRFKNLTSNEVFQYIDGIKSYNWKVRSILDLFDHSFGEADYSTAGLCVSRLQDIFLDDGWQRDQVIRTRLRYAAFQKDFDTVDSLRGEVSWLPFDERWYYDALLAEDQGRVEEVKKLFLLVSGMNSFNEEAVLASASHFQTDDDPLQSYNILVNALLQNQNSAKLLKAYIVEALEQGLISYADRAAADLEKLMEADQYRRFLDSLPAIEDPDL